MVKGICQWILYKRLGYKKIITQELPEKYIICMAPHTSNWDLILGQLFAHAEGIKCNFLMKKEWFFWPFGRLLKRIGGIPVERSKHTSMTDQLAQKAKESSHFSLAITPEGTRSLAKQWKRGFYFIALKAQLPILLYAIDYPNKRIVCTKTLNPSGNVDADMRIIMEYYRQFEGKHPEKFVVEEIAQ